MSVHFADRSPEVHSSRADLLATGSPYDADFLDAAGPAPLAMSKPPNARQTALLESQARARANARQAARAQFILANPLATLASSSKSSSLASEAGASSLAASNPSFGEAIVARAHQRLLSSFEPPTHRALLNCRAVRFPVTHRLGPAVAGIPVVPPAELDPWAVPSPRSVSVAKASTEKRLAEGALPVAFMRGSQDTAIGRTEV